MITSYAYGEPIKTEAVTVETARGDTPPHVQLTQGADFLRFSCPLAPDDVVYGLGETVRGINKRGGRYVSFNCDESNHRDESPSLYGSHNFLIVDGQTSFGAFFDTPARVIFEVDVANSGMLVVTCETKDLCLYMIEGDSAYDITRQFLHAVGQSFIPPLWAFGMGQSRWGYKNARDVEAVVRGYQKAGIPLDYVCMDIDYMDRYIDFTVNKKRFPDLPALVQKLKRQGVRLVPIVDAGVKIEPGNPVYDEGVQQGYFCENREGKPFRAAVWPGMTHFTDFFQPEARAWFGSWYRFYTEQGLEGFWNDMNEPSIFYSEYRPLPADKRALERSGALYQANGALSDYKDFYHNVNGRRTLHYDVHNLYGALMTRAASEQLDKLLDTRFLLFSRASYIGAHRYGGVWTGDNSSTFAHLRLNVCQMPSLNMCGFLFSGADTGGFNGSVTRELLLRWLAVSAFTPLMRDHSSKLSRRQECYKFRKTADFAGIVSLRYRLLPYLYSEFVKAALTRDLFISPLAFGYPDDPCARRIEDQLLVGGSVMIAPVLEQGQLSRRVYLPEPMTEVRYDGKNFTCRAAEAGEREITVPLSEVVFYIRKGKLLPVGPGAMNTAALDLSDVTLLGDGETYEQYLDDGFTKNCTLKNVRVLTRT